MSACQKAFDHLVSHPSTSFPISFRPPANPEPKPSPPKPRKRPYPGGDAMTVDRIIQPRISEFATVNEPFTPPQYQYPLAPATTSEPQRKKRGRPSKAEYEMRLAEYAARGVPYPAPRKSKAPRQSTENLAPTAHMFTSGPEEAKDAGPALTPTATQGGDVGTTPPAKNRSQPSPDEKEPHKGTLNDPARSMDQAQLPPESNDEKTAESGAENTPSEKPVDAQLGPHELLMSQMQEHAARVDHDVMESNRNVPQETQHEKKGTPKGRPWQVYQPPTTT